jgi:predicted dehydrogenase
MSTSRRSFLRTAGATAAAVALSPWAKVLGANEDIRVGVIGFRGRGQALLEGLGKLKGVRIVSLCDVDKDVLEKEVKKRKEKNESVEAHTDLRKLIESKDVDVVATATPNHWHSLISIWSCQAGKDVYVEKPISHNVWEGRQAVEAARKYNRIVQAGTQSRSNPGLREAVEYVQSGKLGKIKVVRGLCYKPRGSIGKVSGEQAIPANIDYDLWCGPAPKSPLLREKLHYDWHWVWETGNGDLGNQGIHQMDIGRWILGEPGLSPKVMSIGGRVGYVDDGQTPNTQMIIHDYEKAPLIFEVRGLPAKKGAKPMDKYHGAEIGVIAHCEEGLLSITSYNGGIAYDKDGKVIKEFKGGGDHFANFIDAVRNRKHTDLNGDILEGHLSSALCHTGNISHLVGKQSSADEIKEAIKGDKEAVETFGRMAEHLGNNEVKLDETKLVLGAMLKMDTKTERFTNNDVANALLTRPYRAPFVVPEKV